MGLPLDRTAIINIARACICANARVATPTSSISSTSLRQQGGRAASQLKTFLRCAMDLRQGWLYRVSVGGTVADDESLGMAGRLNRS